jgi:serine/threonine protein kinase
MTATSGPFWLSDEVLGHLQAVTGADGDPPGGHLAASRYELIEVIGQGGMGTVYLARDHALDREVALKVVTLAPGAAEASNPDSRLFAEARILAGLEHPGLVPVHDLGTLADGRVFYAMKRVRGCRLDAYARDRLPDGRSRLELLRVFERICEAVAFAHAHGVIHRDLKPENVMVGSFGEVLILDWGLAKLRCVAGQPGELAGTPGYMAPEQVRGAVDEVDERTDVFALGAILLFLLTGSPAPSPAAAVSVATADRARAVGPAPPSPPVPKALAAICRKAMAGEPQRRYSGAAEVAADLSCFLAGQPVAAYPETLVRRMLRLARRHATPLLLLLLAYVVMRLVLLLLARRP